MSTKQPSKNPAVPRPNAEEFRGSLSKLQKKIDDLKAKMNGINEKIQKEGDSDANKNAREEQKVLRQNLEKTQALLKEKREEKEKVMNSIREIDKEKIELRKKQKEYEKSTAVTPADIDAQIRKLELDMETAPGISLKKESRIANDIKRLQYRQKNLKQKGDPSSDLTALDEKRKLQLELAETLQREIEESRVSKTTIQQEMGENGQKHVALRESIALLRQEKQTVNSEISKLYDEIRVLKEKYSAEMTEWKRKMDEEREKEAQRRQAADQARQERHQQLQKERQAKEEEKANARKEIERLKRLNPREEEIVICDILIQYLSSNTTSHEKQRTVQFNANAFAKEGMQQFKRSAADEDAWLFGDRGKSKKASKPKAQPSPPEEGETEATSSSSASSKPKAKQAKPDKLLAAMPVAKLQAFDKLGIQPPLRQSDVAGCVEELKKKKAYFESFKRTMEQVIEDEKRQQEEDERRQREEAERREKEQKEAPKDEEVEAEAEVEVESKKDAVAEVLFEKKAEIPKPEASDEPPLQVEDFTESTSAEPKANEVEVAVEVESAAAAVVVLPPPPVEDKKEGGGEE